MTILSLFDGMSCGHLALDRAGVNVSEYFAAEIDKYAITVTQANYPQTIQLGDVTQIKGADLPTIDLLIGGSPCQGFSFAGKQLNFEDPRSVLFFEYVRLRRELGAKNPDLYFLLENVKMKKESQDVITKFLGVEPIEINSALVSAQNRKRLYWTNIEGVEQPEDRGVLLRGILQPPDEVDQSFNRSITNKDFNGLSPNGKSGTLRTSGHDTPTEKHNFDIVKLNKKRGLKQNQNKASCLTSGGNHSDMDIIGLNPASIVGRRMNENGHREDYNKNVPITQCLQVKHSPAKAGCLTTVEKDNVLSNMPPGRYPDAYNNEDIQFRRLTPIECERLQTVPDNYTNHVSNSQRYKMLGNGWTVDVIAHIFKNMMYI